VADRQGRAPLLERLKLAMLKPQDPGQAERPVPEPARSLEELEVANKTADDKERLVGLLAGPIAAAIGFTIITALIDHDPAATLASGKPNKLHVSLSLYHDLLLVLLALSVLMIVTAFWRKRLFLGIVLALYGLAVFNLHYWGFGIPFVMAGAWLLVRSYRLQQQLKAAKAEEGDGVTSHPRQSKRYTPPRAAARTAAPAGRRAG
jgi:hypothetical protein